MTKQWNGEFYANFQDGPSRNWNDVRVYGFISADDDEVFLNMVGPNDKITKREKQGVFRQMLQVLNGFPDCPAAGHRNFISAGVSAAPA